jgi:manganese transport protein
MLAVIPALLVIYFMGDEKVGDMLILSQVILSLQLGFAVIPLIQFVSDGEKMGKFAISKLLKTLAWISALIIVSLNLKLVFEILTEWHMALAEQSWIFSFVIMPLVTLAGVLLCYIIWNAWFGKRFERKMKTPHGRAEEIPVIEKKKYERILICIDFSPSDIKAITPGISQGDKTTSFFLLHVVESAGARSMGNQIEDFETDEDLKELKEYGNKLRMQGFDVKEQLGFGDPKKEIPRLANELNIEMVVIGKHGHRGFKDLIFGETIAEVRHKVKCAVLVV